MKKTLLALCLLIATACGSVAGDSTSSTISTTEVESRIEEIASHVTSWQQATSLEQVTTEAEAAANLVVGPGGPGYGDRNGDGVVSGANDEGLLPSLDGTSSGLVIDAVGDAECVRQDVLGGSWDDPESRWGEMTDAIAAWSSSNNTFPSLASHPMRLVGWATLTQTAGLDQAHEYGSHAGLHIDVTRQALQDC